MNNNIRLVLYATRLILLVAWMMVVYVLAAKAIIQLTGWPPLLVGLMMIILECQLKMGTKVYRLMPTSTRKTMTVIYVTLGAYYILAVMSGPLWAMILFATPLLLAHLTEWRMKRSIKKDTNELE